MTTQSAPVVECEHPERLWWSACCQAGYFYELSEVIEDSHTEANYKVGYCEACGNTAAFYLICLDCGAETTVEATRTAVL